MMRTNNIKYYFHSFEIGDREIFEEPNQKVSAASVMWCKRRDNGWRFKTRKITFRNKSATQITRVK
jgi:hypothetical protein